LTEAAHAPQLKKQRDEFAHQVCLVTCARLYLILKAGQLKIYNLFIFCEKQHPCNIPDFAGTTLKNWQKRSPFSGV
jgi:hypothetical protein